MGCIGRELDIEDIQWEPGNVEEKAISKCLLLLSLCTNVKFKFNYSYREFWAVYFLLQGYLPWFHSNVFGSLGWMPWPIMLCVESLSGARSWCAGQRWAMCTE